MFLGLTRAMPVYTITKEEEEDKVNCEKQQQ